MKKGRGQWIDAITKINIEDAQNTICGKNNAITLPGHANDERQSSLIWKLKDTIAWTMNRLFQWATRFLLIQRSIFTSCSSSNPDQYLTSRKTCGATVPDLSSQIILVTEQDPSIHLTCFTSVRVRGWWAWMRLLAFTKGKWARF